MKKKEKREFLTINETPHYPVTFTSDDHLNGMVEKDRNIIHPLGEVFISKGTDDSNDVRIVVLKSENKNQKLQAFVFNRTSWMNKKNPFNPEYMPSFETRVADGFKRFGGAVKRVSERLEIFSF